MVLAQLVRSSIEGQGIRMTAMAPVRHMASKVLTWDIAYLWISSGMVHTKNNQLTESFTANM